jgi:hypothetical protein
VGDVLIVATPDHYFLTQDKKWRTAGSLVVGDALFDANNPKGQIVCFVARAKERCTVYNMEVEGLHNFFVTSEGILAHNAPAAYMHFFQRAFRPTLGYGARALKAARHLSAIVHTAIHQDLNAWLMNYRGMNLMPRRGMPGTRITATYGFATVEQAMREFYQAKYPQYLTLFEEEVKAIKAGLHYVP